MAGKAVFSPIDPLDIEELATTDAILTAEGGWQDDLAFPVPFNTPADVPAEFVVTTGIGTRTVHFPAVDQYSLMFEAFSRALRAGGPVPTSAQDAIDNMRVEDLPFRSEKSGGWDEVR